MKRLLMLLPLLLLPAMALAQKTVTIDGLEYTLKTSRNIATVTGIDLQATGNIDIPATITLRGAKYTVRSIGAYAFANCKGIATVSLPETVSEIGEHAFDACFGLVSVSIPNTVKHIGKYAFCFCTSLQSITLPNSIKEIGTGVFYECTSLKHVYARRTNPEDYDCNALKEAYSNDYLAFRNIPSACMLHVPKGAGNKYRNTPPWKRFSHIVEN